MRDRVTGGKIGRIGSNFELSVTDSGRVLSAWFNVWPLARAGKLTLTCSCFSSADLNVVAESPFFAASFTYSTIDEFAEMFDSGFSKSLTTDAAKTASFAAKPREECSLINRMISITPKINVRTSSATMLNSSTVEPLSSL